MKTSILAELYNIKKLSNLFDVLHDRADDQFDIYNVDESAPVYDPSDYETRPWLTLDENRNDHVIKRKPTPDYVLKNYDKILDTYEYQPQMDDLKKDFVLKDSVEIDTPHKPLQVYQVDIKDEESL